MCARNHAATLPYVFGQLEQLDYPKQRITVDVYTDNNADTTGEWLTAYAQVARKYYNDVRVNWRRDDDKLDDAGRPFVWSERRYRALVAHKQSCLTSARNAHATYVLYLDADVFVTHPYLLQHLMHERKAIIAPVLSEPFSNYRYACGCGCKLMAHILQQLLGRRRCGRLLCAHRTIRADCAS